MTIANYYQLSSTPLISSDLPLILIGGYQFFTNQCYVYLQLLLIGIGLVIKAPKSPEFTYTVFLGIAWY